MKRWIAFLLCCVMMLLSVSCRVIDEKIPDIPPLEPDRPEEEIPDVFDALVSKRQYKEGMSVDDALAIMAKERGISFEPELFDIFIDARDELVELTKKLNEM